jgi:hypothetical protein
MKKWLIVITLFMMLKSGQEVTFSDKFSYTLFLNEVEFSDGLDRIYIPLTSVRWITNDPMAHKMLKQGTK